MLSLDIGTGHVTAQVQGSRVKPYAVKLTVDPLTTRQWQRVEEALAARAIFRARLLAGEMPAEIEEVFAGCGTPLFPKSARDLEMTCSCPDWEVPCKHVAAVCYVLAEAFDADPFGMLAWRGKGRADLLAALRRLTGGGAAAGDGRPVIDVADAPLSASARPASGPRRSARPGCERCRQRRPRPPTCCCAASSRRSSRRAGMDLVTLLRPAYLLMAMSAEARLRQRNHGSGATGRETTGSGATGRGITGRGRRRRPARTAIRSGRNDLETCRDYALDVADIFDTYQLTQSMGRDVRGGRARRAGLIRRCWPLSSPWTRPNSVIARISWPGSSPTAA